MPRWENRGGTAGFRWVGLVRPKRWCPSLVASLHREGNDQLWASRQTRRYFCYAIGLAFCIALEAICMYMTSHALWQYLWVMAEGNQGGGGQPQTLCPSPDLAPEHSTDNTVSTCGLSSAGRRHGWGPRVSADDWKTAWCKPLPAAQWRSGSHLDTESRRRPDFLAWRTKLSDRPLRLAFL